MYDISKRGWEIGLDGYVYYDEQTGMVSGEISLKNGPKFTAGGGTSGIVYDPVTMQRVPADLFTGTRSYNEATGEYTITVTGKGSFYGSISKTFKLPYMDFADGYTFDEETLTVTPPSGLTQMQQMDGAGGLAYLISSTSDVLVIQPACGYCAGVTRGKNGIHFIDARDASGNALYLYICESERGDDLGEHPANWEWAAPGSQWLWRGEAGWSVQYPSKVSDFECSGVEGKFLSELSANLGSFENGILVSMDDMAKRAVSLKCTNPDCDHYGQDVSDNLYSWAASKQTARIFDIIHP